MWVHDIWHRNMTHDTRHTMHDTRHTTHNTNNNIRNNIKLASMLIWCKLFVPLVPLLNYLCVCVCVGIHVCMLVSVLPMSLVYGRWVDEVREWISSLTISDQPSVVLSTQVSFGSEARSKFRLSISGHSDDDSGGQRTPLRAGTTVSGYYCHPTCA